MRRIESKTLRGYLQGISGLFISPVNPGGLTPTELDVLTTIIFLLEQEQLDRVTTTVRSRVGEMMNYPPQVVTNYIKKLRDKKVLTANNEPHPLLKESEVTIQRPKTQENKDNV